MSAKFYIKTIEGESFTGVIVSPTDIENMLGEEIDTDAMIVWHYMGTKVYNDDPVRIQVFINWVRNLLTKTGAIVEIQ